MEFTPKQIITELDRFIIGQDKAKRAVAIALRNRYRRSRLTPELRQEITPKNIIMQGPTGVGKTEIARRLCDAFKAFKVKYDASLDYAAEPSAAESSSVRKPDDSPAETPAAVRDGYGVQIFALSKKLPAGDASLKGYEADAVKAGSMYKYIIRCNTADEARKLFRKTRKEFPGSFPVQIRSGKVSALK